MAKRVADKYITDQNWDQEEDEGDSEGPGKFRKAESDVLKSRIFRKAKRRVPPGQGVGMPAFSGFTGLKAPISTAKSTLTVSQGLNLPQNASALKQMSLIPGSIGDQGANHPFKTLSSKSTFDVPVSKPSVAKINDEDDSSQSSSEYVRHLSALNRSVSEWIKNHVEKNPICDLTPIFHDYKKHLASIDEKFGQSDNEGSQSSGNTASDSQETFSLPSSQSLSQSSDVSDKPKFSLTGFGSKADSPKSQNSIPSVAISEAPLSKPLFTGFQMSAKTTFTSPFKGFPSTSGFSFGASMVGAADQKQNNAQQQSSTNEEEYVPPKPESNVVVEEDAFFSIRCKLYYKKDDTYADRGVGQLYLKPSESKTQLLIRADTAISQILLNINLSSSIPIQKQGKNNILIMCIPNPPINEKEKDKVTPMLIRVKTSEDADKLLEIMEEKKKESES